MTTIDRRRFGEIRDDGYRFWGYEKRKLKNGELKISERWASPESFERMCKSSKRNAAKWIKENPERHRENVKRWESKNMDKVREMKRIQFRRHYSKNKDKYIAYAAARDKRVIENARQNTPSENKTIMAIYESSGRASKCSGIRFHVDHIKPISRGGRHNPNNLQILPERINLIKGASDFIGI